MCYTRIESDMSYSGGGRISHAQQRSTWSGVSKSGGGSYPVTGVGDSNISFPHARKWSVDALRVGGDLAQITRRSVNVGGL